MPSYSLIRKSWFSLVLLECGLADIIGFISSFFMFSKIPECNHLIEAGKKRGLMIMAVVPKPNDGTKGLLEFYPTAEALLEVGVGQVYEPPHGSKFDVVECAVSFSREMLSPMPVHGVNVSQILTHLLVTSSGSPEDY
jgi:hypothetical protein